MGVGLYLAANPVSYAVSALATVFGTLSVEYFLPPMPPPNRRHRAVRGVIFNLRHPHHVCVYGVHPADGREQSVGRTIGMRHNSDDAFGTYEELCHRRANKSGLK